MRFFRVSFTVETHDDADPEQVRAVMLENVERIGDEIDARYEGVLSFLSQDDVVVTEE